MRGKLITLYGINNIGKSTHAHLLVKRLQDAGHEVVYVKYPIYDMDPTGSFLNRVLRHSDKSMQGISEEELQMWFTLNRHQFQPTLEEWLASGKIVVAEDYTGTGIGWGVTKGADRAWLETLNQHLMKEDFGMLLEGTRSMHSKEERHIHESNDELVDKAQATFSDLATRYGWTRIQMEPMKEDSAEKIYTAVKNFLSAA